MKHNAISRKRASEHLSYEQRESKTPRFLTVGARKQINSLKRQGWMFAYTFLYPSGKVAHHLTHDGKTAILREDGSIEMLYPVGTTVIDSMKKRPVTQGYGGDPNPPGVGKAFTFHGAFNSKILARRREKEIPGSFIQEKNGRYYVLKPKKVRTRSNPRNRGTLIYGKVIKIYAQKTAGPFKGQRFVHTFKPGAVMYGLPDGSLRITHP